MIELLIAISVFSVIVAVASGIFISSLRSNRLAVSLITANSDASLTLDQMSRMIRKGLGRSFISERILADDGSVSFKCLKFKYGNYYITYRWNRADKSLEWNDSPVVFANCSDSNLFSGIISENLRVEFADFMMQCEVSVCSKSDTDYPKITILLRVSTRNTQLSTMPFTNLQTTISARNDLRY